MTRAIPGSTPGGRILPWALALTSIACVVAEIGITIRILWIG